MEARYQPNVIRLDKKDPINNESKMSDRIDITDKNNGIKMEKLDEIDGEWLIDPIPSGMAKNIMANRWFNAKKCVTNATGVIRAQKCISQIQYITEPELNDEQRRILYYK